MLQAITWTNADQDLYGVIRPQWVHFADYIFRLSFNHENMYVLIQISLQFVPKSPINNESALV